jgi:hypothetical protein
MATKVIRVEIKGKSPLLMHKYPMEPIEGIDKKSPEEQAEYAAYRDEATKILYIPSLCLQRALVGSAVFSKGKGRASLQKVVASCVMVSPVSLFLGTKDYVVDSQRVVIPSTKGSVIRHRPRLDIWKVAFDVEYDDTLMKEEQLRKVVDDAGQRVGLLDFRPACKGPYGRFMVTSWKPDNNI